MLHAVCSMLHAVLYAVCCILHAILKALGDARIIQTFVKKKLSTIIKHLFKMGSGGSLERSGALPGGHVASGLIFHRFGAPCWEPFGTMLGSKIIKRIFLVIPGAPQS